MARKIECDYNIGKTMMMELRCKLLEQKINNILPTIEAHLQDNSAGEYTQAFKRISSGEEKIKNIHQMC